ncbi:MAG: B12-binding domain-containing radical SAM protein, partial [bacterium]
IQYTRGCPFNCDFCDVTQLFGHKLRSKNAEQVVDELENIYRSGWRGGVFFVDDNFIGNKKNLKANILPKIISWMKQRKHPFVFNTQCSIDLADDVELINMMVSAGFNTVFVGIETPEEDSLAECGKYQNSNRDLVECVKIIQRHGIQVQGGFILGFDSDKPNIFDRMAEFIQNSGIVTAMVGLLKAPKGTELYKRLERENRLLKNWTGNNTDTEMDFIPKMDTNTLIEGYNEVIKKLYTPKNFYARVKTLLRNYRPNHNSHPRIRFSDMKALVKSFWVIGVIGKGRTHYWRLLFWSMFRCPRSIPIAVTLAIYGFHFRKIYQV